MDSKTLERYRQMFQEAQSSVDYWLDGPIVDFTEDICRLMKEKNVSKAELARCLGTSRASTKLLGGNAGYRRGTGPDQSQASPEKPAVPGQPSR